MSVLSGQRCCCHPYPQVWGDTFETVSCGPCSNMSKYMQFTFSGLTTCPGQDSAYNRTHYVGQRSVGAFSCYFDGLSGNFTIAWQIAHGFAKCGAGVLSYTRMALVYSPDRNQYVFHAPDGPGWMLFFHRSGSLPFSTHATYVQPSGDTWECSGTNTLELYSATGGLVTGWPDTVDIIPTPTSAMPEGSI